MRVVLTASTFPLRRDDGTPAFVLGLARALAERAEVTVLAPGAAGAARDEVWDGVRVRRFDYFWPRAWQRLAHGDGMETNLRRSWLARVQVPMFIAAEARATRKLVAECGAELVNSHWILPQGLSAAWARGRRPRFRHVVTLHGGDAHLLARSSLTHPLARFVAGRCDAFLVSSRAVRAALDAALGRDSHAGVQPMGVDTQRFYAAAPLAPEASGLPAGYLLYVGRLQQIKGVEVLIDALARLRARHPELGLLVFGYGECEPQLRAQVDRLGLRDAVRFAGAQSSDAVASALRGCRACVVPSLRLASGREEGMPTVVAEALAAGAPLVATATGGIPDVIRDGETGWLCGDGDPDALADALSRALGPGAAEVAERGRAAGADFDWARVAERYWETFERVSRG